MNNGNRSNRILVGALGLAGLLGAGSHIEVPQNMHLWLKQMHLAQSELLKIRWGQPGFCTEWDQDFDLATRSCGRRGKLVRGGRLRTESVR